MAMTYSEQLRHPYWQRKRLEALQAADFACSGCGRKEKTLHVHHKRYVKGRLAWEYSLAELEVLCADCHEDEHVFREKIDAIVRELSQPTVFPLLLGFRDMRVGMVELSKSHFPHPQSEREYLVGMIAGLLVEACERSDVVVRFVGALMLQNDRVDFKALGEKLLSVTGNLPKSLRATVDKEAAKT